MEFWLFFSALKVLKNMKNMYLEALKNMKNMYLAKIIEAYKGKNPLEAYLHEIALKALHEYPLIGELTEAVDRF